MLRVRQAVRDRLRKYVRDFETLPGDAALCFRRGGFPELWETLADRSVHRLFRRGRLLVIAQMLDRVRLMEPPAGVVIRRAMDGDWAAMGSIVLQRDLDRFRLLAAAGRVCLVAWREGRPIGYTWHTDRIGRDVSQLPLQLPPEAGYGWDLYVVPSERSHRVGSALVSARLEYARLQGLRESWRAIAPSNQASLRTMARTAGDGTRVVGEVRFVKLLSKIHARFVPWDSASSIPG